MADVARGVQMKEPQAITLYCEHCNYPAATESILATHSYSVHGICTVVFKRVGKTRCPYCYFENHTIVRARRHFYSSKECRRLLFMTAEEIKDDDSKVVQESVSENFRKMQELDFSDKKVIDRAYYTDPEEPLLVIDPPRISPSNSCYVKCCVRIKGVYGIRST